MFFGFVLGVAERGKEKLLKTTCNHILLTHLHPRTAVNITIQEMQDGGTVKFLISKLLFLFILHIYVEINSAHGSINECSMPCTNGFWFAFAMSCSCCDLSSG